MKKYIYLIVVFLVIIGIVLTKGCADKTPIKIGVVGTMSGLQSDLSVSGRRGIELAVRDLNNKGGIKGRMVELVVKDDDNDPVRAEAIVEEFVDEDVSLVIGHFTSGMMLAAYQSLEAHDILYLGPTISTDNLSQKDDHFIRFIASTQAQAEIINTYAHKADEKDFLVIVDNKNVGYSQFLLNNFKTLLEEKQGQILDVFSYDLLDDDGLEAVETFVKSQPTAQAVFVISNASDLGAVAQKLRKSKHDISLYGSLWSRTTDLVRLGGEYVEGVKVVSAVDEMSRLPAYLAFADKYKETYGRSSTFSSVYAYDTCMALAEALEALDDISVDKVKAKIIEIGDFEGLQQPYHIDAYGDNTRQYMMDQVINGEFIRIE